MCLKQKKALIISVLIGILLILGIHTIMNLKTNIGKNTKVVCVGDSITEGIGIKPMLRETKSYPSKLSDFLGNKFTVANLGISGVGILDRSGLPYRKQPEYIESFNLEPDIVLLALGTNDSRTGIWNSQVFALEYEKIVDDYLNSDKKPKIYLILPPPILIDSALYDNDILENELIPIINKIAEEKGLKTIDVYTLFDENKNYFADGVHPNVKGARAMAKLCFNVITSD